MPFLDGLNRPFFIFLVVQLWVRVEIFLCKYVPIDADVEVLKLDVQGFELEVLKGAAQALPRVKTVVLEINTPFKRKCDR
jgi:hypothetical protein